MYRLENITSIHLEITSKCQARCPMCPRRLNGGIMDPFVKLDEITLDQFKLWFSVEFIKQLGHISLCGNLGDPVAAKDTVKICEYLRSINPQIGLQIHTNGSARDLSWWRRLAELKVVVVFAIDGLEDTHHLYRINTDWHKIIKNAKTFIEAGGDARWDMLVFDHNKHQVDQCREMSQQLGFKDFYSKHTSRFRDGKFDVLDDTGKTINVLYPTNKSEVMIDKIKKSQEETLPKITCKAQASSELYVSATGNVTPCCWIDLEWQPPVSTQRIDYMNKVGIFPNLKKNTLEEIFNSGYFDKISKCWTTTSLRICSKQCGSFDRLNEQFVKSA